MPTRDCFVNARIVAAVVAVALVAGASMPARGFEPPPEGYKVTHVFPGARTVGSTVATSVHCTYVDDKGSVVMRAEFYDFNGTLNGSGEVALGPGATGTISASSTGATSFYDNELSVALTGDLDQGSVRVLSFPTTKIVCTAQVLAAGSSPPAFVITLPHFSATGKH